MKFTVSACLCCIFLTSANAFFLNARRTNSHSQYGPPKPHYRQPQKPSYKPPTKPVYESAVEHNEIDDGYGSPAAPVVSYKPETTYHEPPKIIYKEPTQPVYHPPMKPTYHPPPKPMPMYKMPMHRMPLYRKTKLKPMYMMFPKMPRYKFPKMRLPKFMRMMPKLPKFPRMPMYGRYKPSRPMKPVQHYKPVHDHGGYKHTDNLDYSGWTPIGMTYPAPEEPSYNTINESPILTIEDAYKSPSSNHIPPLPSGDGYNAPEPITAAPAAAESYGVPHVDPVSYAAPKPTYKEPEKDSYGTPAAPVVLYKEPEVPAVTYKNPVSDTYGKPQAEPVSYGQVTYAKPIIPEPAYKEPEQSYKEPEKESYGTPQAPPVSYKQPEHNEYKSPPLAPSPTPPYHPPPSIYTPSTPVYQSPATYHQPTYGGYNSPIEEPLFQYAPVSDLNNLAAVEDNYHPTADPPSPARYQATADASRLAQEVQSGSVYVQPHSNVHGDGYQQNVVSYPSYGEKIPTSNQYGITEPLYYQSKPYSQTQYASPTSTYQGTGGKSSASFSIHVNGKEHGHSYSHDHKV